jgi:hypothetical protein
MSLLQSHFPSMTSMKEIADRPQDRADIDQLLARQKEENGK